MPWGQSGRYCIVEYYTDKFLCDHTFFMLFEKVES